MAQDRLIKLVSEGGKDGVGKGHVYYSFKNKRKLAEKKLSLKKYNPIARAHTIYKERKK